MQIFVAASPGTRSGSYLAGLLKYIWTIYLMWGNSWYEWRRDQFEEIFPLLDKYGNKLQALLGNFDMMEFQHINAMKQNYLTPLLSLNNTSLWSVLNRCVNRYGPVNIQYVDEAIYSDGISAVCVWFWWRQLVHRADNVPPVPV